MLCLGDLFERPEVSDLLSLISFVAKPHRGGLMRAALPATTSTCSRPRTSARRPDDARPCRAPWRAERGGTGFPHAITGQGFAKDLRVSAHEPPVALISIDNALARPPIENVGFDRVIGAGLGKGPHDFLGFDLHTLPAARGARTAVIRGTVRPPYNPGRF